MLPWLLRSKLDQLWPSNEWKSGKTDVFRRKFADNAVCNGFLLPFSKSRSRCKESHPGL